MCTSASLDQSTLPRSNEDCSRSGGRVLKRRKSTLRGNLLLLDTVRVFSVVEDKAIEICPEKSAGKETECLFIICQRASAYNGLFQSGPRVAEIRSLRSLLLLPVH